MSETQGEITTAIRPKMELMIQVEGEKGKGPVYDKIRIYSAPEDLSDPRRYIIKNSKDEELNRSVLDLDERVKVETDLFGSPLQDTADEFDKREASRTKTSYPRK